MRKSRRDRRIFKKTANRTRKVNTNPVITRGGTCL